MVAASNHPLNCLSCHIWGDFTVRYNVLSTPTWCKLCNSFTSSCSSLHTAVVSSSTFSQRFLALVKVSALFLSEGTDTTLNFCSNSSTISLRIPKCRKIINSVAPFVRTLFSFVIIECTQLRSVAESVRISISFSPRFSTRLTLFIVASYLATLIR